ncbi:hypothetical protein FH972_003354 [Carpinus fangiana]|uniref:Uncharacterized protein n=1 Tax=Carpinus fangiana TaxID=176857 RepID=A0A5N6QI80_9ROSI|nr:hypothetical protein FH972_003354 [Carpinus fangiana]
MDRVIQPPLFPIVVDEAASENVNYCPHGFLQVDTTACLCRVDAGLKTVAGAKRFVPGSKLCLQPDIKPSIHPTRSKPSRSDRSRNQSPLLPGLPDDLAIACLIRVPRAEHRKLRLALEAAALLPLNGKLCIIRNNMSISLVDVLKSEDVRGPTAEHLWETIAGKGQFKTLVTNLLSSLAGRSRLKSHIVHCQVLQA